MAIVACYHRHCVLTRAAPLLATTSLHKRPLFPTRESRGDMGHIAPFRSPSPVDRRLVAALRPTHSCAEDLVGGTLVFSNLELISKNVIDMPHRCHLVTFCCGVIGYTGIIVVHHETVCLELSSKLAIEQ